MSQRTILAKLEVRLRFYWNREGVAGCHKFLGVRILCSCNCPHGPGCNVPVSLQQDIRCSLLWMDKCYTFKGQPGKQSIEKGPLCMKVKVAQWCPTLCDPRDSTVHGILQARILEWVAFLFSRGSSRPRDPTQISSLAGKFYTTEPPGKTRCYACLGLETTFCYKGVEWAWRGTVGRA